MKTKKISGSKLWQAVQQDPLIMNSLPTPEHQAAYGHYVKFDLLMALFTLLNKPASLETILRAQLEHAKSAMTTGLTKQLAAIDLGEPVDQMPAMVDMAVQGMVQTIVSVMQSIADDIDGYLEQHNTTEREQLEATQLTPDNTEKILRRELSIGDLLLLQPCVILQPQAE